jgi:hypothetical protein
MGLRADVLNIGSVELNEEKNDVKSTALCVTAERLEGSPPPELPIYAGDCAAKGRTM